MFLTTTTLPNDHNWFIFGDKHDGSMLSSESGWQCLVDMMHSKYDGCRNNFGVDGGDMIEGIIPNDPRFRAGQMKEDQVLNQIKSAIARRRPIAKLLKVILQGNHEESLWRFGDIAKQISEELGVPYGTASTKITVLDGKEHLMYKIFDTHGRRSITSTADDPKRRKANLELTLKRQLKFKAGDCAVMIKHHVHKLLVCKPDSELYLTDNGKRIEQNYTHWGQGEQYIHPDARWYGCAGSFLKLYGEDTSGYAELAEYDPVELGFLVLKVRDRKIVSLDPVYLQI